MARRKVADVNIDGMGAEPTWENQNDLSESEFKSKVGTALGWYNYFYDKKDGKKTLVDYLKKHKFDKDIVAAVQKAPDWSVGSTIVALCKMRNRGLERKAYGANADDWFNRRLGEIVEHGKSVIEVVEEEKPTAPVISIQQRMTETAAKQSEEIEDAIEEFAKNGYKGSFETFKMLQKNQVKGMIAQRMLGFYAGEADELEEALEGKDEQLVEGYSHFKKAELKRFAQFMRSICDDLERWISNQKATRKPRKTKAKPVHKIVEKVKYKKTDTDYKLQSVQPETIVGAMQLWVFNTKYRTLGVYNACDRGGLTVKGTTLQNFEEKTSVKKKLRKPDEVIQRCLTGGKIVMRKLMDEINAKESALNGRLNEETILLKVVK
jgi:hypothetical protein